MSSTIPVSNFHITAFLITFNGLHVNIRPNVYASLYEFAANCNTGIMG